MDGRNNKRDLSRAMDWCGKDLSTAEEIVDDLRSRYGKYARLTRQALVLNVRNVLNARNNNKKRVKEDEEEDDNNDSDEGTGGKMKKQRRLEDKSVSSSSLEDSDGHISTSEDAKVSPRFDLINVSLRNQFLWRRMSKLRLLPTTKECLKGNLLLLHLQKDLLLKTLPGLKKC